MKTTNSSATLVCRETDNCKIDFPANEEAFGEMQKDRKMCGPWGKYSSNMICKEFRMFVFCV